LIVWQLSKIKHLHGKAGCAPKKSRGVAFHQSFISQFGMMSAISLSRRYPEERIMAVDKRDGCTWDLPRTTISDTYDRFYERGYLFQHGFPKKVTVFYDLLGWFWRATAMGVIVTEKNRSEEHCTLPMEMYQYTSAVDSRLNDIIQPVYLRV
jgi:hypothetical protein